MALVSLVRYLVFELKADDDGNDTPRTSVENSRLTFEKRKLGLIPNEHYSIDSRRSNIARGWKTNKQISLADQGFTRSFHWSRAISNTSFFSFLNF